MKFDLRKRRWLLWGLLVPVIVLTVLAVTVQGIWMALGIAGVLAYVIAAQVLWRCPYCGKSLGRLDEGGSYCRHCGRRLPE